MFSFNKLKKKNKFKLVEGRIQIGHKMIDVVAHDCITLVESLNKLPGEQEKLSFIEEYLQDADILHQPIAEFPEGMYLNNRLFLNKFLCNSPEFIKHSAT